MKELIWYPKIKSQVILHEKDEDYPFGQYAQKKEINDKKSAFNQCWEFFGGRRGENGKIFREAGNIISSSMMITKFL